MKLAILKVMVPGFLAYLKTLIILLWLALLFTIDTMHVPMGGGG
jgi:hypothetical protein